MKAKYLLHILVVFSLFTTSCDKVSTVTKLRPDENGIISWLTGQRVMIEKGILIDDYWTIERSEVADIKVTDITEVGGIYTASLQFKCQTQGKGIAVSGNIRYKAKGNVVIGGVCEFVDFTPIGVQKFGNW